MFSVMSVCLPVCLQGWRPHVTATHNAIGQSQVTWAPLHTCSNLFTWDPPIPYPGPSPHRRPVKICSRCSPYIHVSQVGGWPSTEKTSCCVMELYFQITIIYLTQNFPLLCFWCHGHLQIQFHFQQLYIISVSQTRTHGLLLKEKTTYFVRMG